MDKKTSSNDYDTELQATRLTCTIGVVSILVIVTLFPTSSPILSTMRGILLALVSLMTTILGLYLPNILKRWESKNRQKEYEYKRAKLCEERDEYTNLRKNTRNRSERELFSQKIEEIETKLTVLREDHF
ncbi:hypothetical protein [Candidatus Albibeggiatoa sp. nov. BB20]|uniref:hypothetical protein n=1 Tax=Candidatus Albibeggiatoa sp. nov. BB20 TaxID=3162723 RepID=UPI0033658A6F